MGKKVQFFSQKGVDKKAILWYKKNVISCNICRDCVCIPLWLVNCTFVTSAESQMRGISSVYCTKC